MKPLSEWSWGPWSWGLEEEEKNSVYTSLGQPLASPRVHDCLCERARVRCVFTHELRHTVRAFSCSAFNVYHETFRGSERRSWFVV